MWCCQSSRPMWALRSVRWASVKLGRGCHFFVLALGAADLNRRGGLKRMKDEG